MHLRIQNAPSITIVLACLYACCIHFNEESFSSRRSEKIIEIQRACRSSQAYSHCAALSHTLMATVYETSKPSCWPRSGKSEELPFTMLLRILYLPFICCVLSCYHATAKEGTNQKNLAKAPYQSEDVLC